jgi:hypothetical protein
MAISSDKVRSPESADAQPSQATKSSVSMWVIAGWAAVIGALVTAGVLLVLVLSSGGGPSTVDASRRAAMSRTVAEHGSVGAIDHRDRQAALSAAMTRTVIEHGSVSAIDHRDRQAVLSAAMTRVVAEHGSVSAIDHRDEVAARATEGG